MVPRIPSEECNNKCDYLEFLKIVLLQIVLQAKKEIYDVKQQRLCLAQDEYNHLNNALTTLGASRTSCEYTFTLAVSIFRNIFNVRNIL